METGVKIGINGCTKLYKQIWLDEFLHRISG